MNKSDTKAIEPVPAPWTLTGKIWTLPIYVTSKMAAILSSDKDFTHSDLESKSPYSNDKLVGGLSMMQIIRYTDTPAGAYDELVMMPGYYEYNVEVKNKEGKPEIKKQKNLRATKIFVSQKTTCWNGRTNWSIPKHLAKFDFQNLVDGSTSVSVYPMEADESGIESKASKTPFFSATFKCTPFLPAFPMSTSIVKYLGIDISLAQPPLPEGKGAQGELPGNDRWCQVLLTESSSKTSIGWWDLTARETTENDAFLSGLEPWTDDDLLPKYENWWPGLGRWRIGMLMEDAVIECPEGRHWAPLAQ